MYAPLSVITCPRTPSTRPSDVAAISSSLEIRPTRQNLAEINPLIQESFKLHLPRQPKASSLLEKALDGVG